MDDEYQIEVQVEIPSDSDGFIRRECPTCTQQFKWHAGPATEEAEQHRDPETYNCPLCGQPADAQSWLTREQAELVQQAAMPEVLDRVSDEIEGMFRGVKGMSYTRGSDEPPDESVPLTEPDDMVIVASPCHSYEPVKIPELHAGRLYCLICGSAFAT